MIADILFSASHPQPVTVGSLRTEVLSTPEDYALIFARDRVLLCGDLIDPDSLNNLIEHCRHGGFVADYVDHLGSRKIESPPRVGGILTLVLSRPPFLCWREAVTGCGSLTRVDGRVIQARANGVDALDWHDDPARRLAITINLSDGAYDGGTFELCNVASQRMLATHRPDRPGSALIFDVADDIDTASGRSPAVVRAVFIWAGFSAPCDRFPKHHVV